MPANNQPAFRPDLSRRPDAPGTNTMSGMNRRPDGGAEDMRKLIVGPGIAFNGEISACDYLVVEGTVEAKVKEGRRLEIAEGGLFRGSVEIDEAEIAGKFEGDLTVRGRLNVRGSGRIEGKVQYGELAVEAGGSIDGEMKSVAVAPVAMPKPRITGMNEMLGDQPAASSAA
jgi:cytoskeletal protein CcmA (bactofilin family)